MAATTVLETHDHAPCRPLHLPPRVPPTSGEAPRRSQRGVTGSGSGELVGMRSIHQAAAVGFDTGAEAYERGRPGFPAEAVERLVGELRIEADSRLVDLAAGTGKLTRMLVATGARLIAIEPVE